MTDIGKLLHADGIQEAENITGKSYKTDHATDMLGLGLVMHKNRAVETALRATGDTTFSMVMDDYLAVVEDIGFQKVLEIPFTSEQWPENGEQRFYVYWHPLRGILLKADTFGSREGKPTRNSANVAFNWRCSPFYAERPYSERMGWWTGGGSSSSAQGDESVQVMTLDVREAIRWKLDGAAQFGAFVTPWVEHPVFWLTHHGDKTARGYDGIKDYDRIHEERVALLPEQAQRIIGRRRLPTGLRAPFPQVVADETVPPGEARVVDAKTGETLGRITGLKE